MPTAKEQILCTNHYSLPCMYTQNKAHKDLTSNQKHTAFVAQRRGIAIAIPPQSNLVDVHKIIVSAIKDPR